MESLLSPTPLVTASKTPVGHGLYLRPMTEISALPVAEKEAALIEWALQYEGEYRFEVDESLLKDFGPTKPTLWSLSPQDRVATIEGYKNYIRSLSGHTSFELKPLKAVVKERLFLLEKLLKARSAMTIQEILSSPGFERYATSSQKTLEVNQNTFLRVTMEKAYPKALLYSLFWTDAGKFLEEVRPPFELTEREMIFYYWLQDTCTPDPTNWLTLSAINHRNELLPLKKKVFKENTPLKNSSEAVRQLIGQLREKGIAIETKPEGKAWRLQGVNES